MALASVPKVIFGLIAICNLLGISSFPSCAFSTNWKNCRVPSRAVLMVLLRVITPEEAYDTIDLQILGLLFGTMVVSVYLERADIFKYLGKCSLGKPPTNSFLLALASSANIGSSATPIGNPQNLVIAVQSKISFGNFLIEWNSHLESINIQISPNHVQILRNRASTNESEIHGVPSSSTFDSARNSNVSLEGINGVLPSMTREETSSSNTNSEAVDSQRDANVIHSSERKNNLIIKWKRILWKSSVYAITLGMLVALLLGLNMSWTAITAALALVVLDFKDARPCLEKVSYSLLIFFCGMFITVDGLNKTGIPSALWDLMEPYCQVDHASGIAILLLGGRIAASAAAISKAEEKKAWLILAWVSTVAGNFSLLGSAANLIVCEQARRAPNLAYTLTFWTHLKFGLPSTLIVTAIGLTLIR
ncbi:Citrate transporter-like domain [Sesbania bispinosa]|nr:Citrate transporter-like domain [Sesbania bispinosa]